MILLFPTKKEADDYRQNTIDFVTKGHETACTARSGYGNYSTERDRQAGEKNVAFYEQLKSVKHVDLS